MDLKYDDILNKNNLTPIKYNENTNIFAYYIITTILINNYQSFLSWCQKHNTSLLQFGKTIVEQDEFCKFINNKYKNKNMLDAIKCTEEFVSHFNDEEILINSLRMTVCEMG